MFVFQFNRLFCFLLDSFFVVLVDSQTVHVYKTIQNRVHTVNLNHMAQCVGVEVVCEWFLLGATSRTALFINSLNLLLLGVEDLYSECSQKTFPFHKRFINLHTHNFTEILIFRFFLTYVLYRICDSFINEIPKLTKDFNLYIGLSSSFVLECFLLQ